MTTAPTCKIKPGQKVSNFCSIQHDDVLGVNHQAFDSFTTILSVTPPEDDYIHYGNDDDNDDDDSFLACSAWTGNQTRPAEVAYRARS